MHHRFPSTVVRFPFPVSGPLFLKREKNLRFSSLTHFSSSFLLHLHLYCKSLTYLGTYLPVLLLIAKGYRELHRLGEGREAEGSGGERRVA